MRKADANLAAELMDDAYRILTKPLTGEAAILAHFRATAVIGLALRRTNMNFNARSWVVASIPEVMRATYPFLVQRAEEAIEAKSMRVWDDDPQVREIETKNYRRSPVS